jgi:hypothetical protein
MASQPGRSRLVRNSVSGVGRCGESCREVNPPHEHGWSPKYVWPRPVNHRLFPADMLGPRFDRSSKSGSCVTSRVVTKRCSNEKTRGLSEGTAEIAALPVVQHYVRKLDAVTSQSGRVERVVKGFGVARVPPGSRISSTPRTWAPQILAHSILNSSARPRRPEVATVILGLRLCRGVLNTVRYSANLTRSLLRP